MKSAKKGSVKGHVTHNAATLRQVREVNPVKTEEGASAVAGREPKARNVRNGVGFPWVENTLKDRAALGVRNANPARFMGLDEHP